MFFKDKKNKEEVIVDASENEEKQDWNMDEGQLVIDVYETERDLIVQAAISGIKTEDLDISLENDMLIIKGERLDPNRAKSKKYFVQECYFGPFSREIILPREIDTSKIKAEIKEGILTIKMPKIERAKNKRINLDEESEEETDLDEERPVKKASPRSKKIYEEEPVEEDTDTFEEEE